ncbi:5-formyltetrahydrofolate cyclo-ligase [Anaeromyxobacter oryzisoli]|uniref:5-formyltetrahydrofolate cyclo-ligase n=1 Tax=Anaeromyxobacter oryzisoli TaxID=2925408 RepID=UPI001F5AB524|nr:5-formyltetrahydrofolate cyclo-ligase [Anaeromyxobacter sp. SG63]
MTSGGGTTAGDAKRALRSEVLARRARLTQAERAEGSHAIAERVEQVATLRHARLVALYAPLGTEVDTGEIGRLILGRGGKVAYPRSVNGDRRLEFCLCAPAELVQGPLGAREPPPDAPAIDLADVDCVVVPGVAFSVDGHRLGRGGGYYDATLEAMPRAARVGVAFEVQLVASLPREPHDAALDALVTEARALAFSRESR